MKDLLRYSDGKYRVIEALKFRATDRSYWIVFEDGSEEQVSEQTYRTTMLFADDDD